MILFLLGLVNCNKYEDYMKIGFKTQMEMKTDVLWPCGWWLSANVVTQVARYEEITGDRSAVSALDNLYEGAKSQYEGNFINDYYDDNGWWGLAWIDTYQITGTTKYLDMAKTIFKQMTSGWDTTNKCKGGLFWKKNPLSYKSAISNSLFNLLSSRLYEITGDKSYSDWFIKSMNWFFDSGIIDGTNMVKDGLNDDCNPTGQCYTYNQGCCIGSLIMATRLTGNNAYLAKAEQIAQASMKTLVVDGVLSDINEGTSGDGEEFKGPFIRHFGELYRTTNKDIYKDFILKCADSIIEKDYDATTKSFGAHWYGPFVKKSSVANSVALECLQEAYDITNDSCGVYDKSSYTCQQGQLCPIINGEAYKNCNGACYSDKIYKCVNGALQQI
ncbi:glycoside hydrolase [Tritrichomonas foetus]|uniref:Glycoside hydrolase n=1 Tax=Tritrichomonas foetus TaxID=1144522 RepID=A0A1J4JH65_9EUKA|nr:glycoside hydrolase [Tritrichomonas foetus]|eukprot:OHS98496.1 glycoside hydrolase [Tritrichomonas foetus]